MKKIHASFENLNGIGLLNLAQNLVEKNIIQNESEVFEHLRIVNASTDHGETVANCKCIETKNQLGRPCDFCKEKNLQESKRKTLARASVELAVGYGHNGYRVTIPDPQFEPCPDCLSYDKWKFVDLESESVSDNTYIFECTDKTEDGTCGGRLNFIERAGREFTKKE